MRSYLAAVVAVAVCTLQAQSLAYHVHAPDDTHQEDDQHRHGPAIHDHGHGDFDRQLHVEAEDTQAGGTVLIVAVPVAAAIVAAVADAEMTEALRAPELQLIGDARAVDVRSHGPPPRALRLLRGPPSSALL